MVLAAAALRVLPHPPNVTPIAAMAVFAGARFDRRRWAFAVPLAAMLVSDAALEVLFGWGFHSQMAAVYLSFALITCIGFWLRRRRGIVPVATAVIASSTLFFATTNFAVWATGGSYPPTAAGLAACYIAAIPFYGLALAGDLVYAAILFGAFAFAQRRFPIFALPKTA